MSEQIKTLEAKYREYAEAYGAAVERGDAKVTNKNYGKLVALLPKLRACGKQGEAVLRRLMKSHSDTVASWAATHSLAFAEAEALEVLDTIGKKHGLIPFDARMVAEQWRKGQLSIR